MGDAKVGEEDKTEEAEAASDSNAPEAKAWGFVPVHE